MKLAINTCQGELIEEGNRIKVFCQSALGAGYIIKLHQTNKLEWEIFAADCLHRAGGFAYVQNTWIRTDTPSGNSIGVLPCPKGYRDRVAVWLETQFDKLPREEQHEPHN